ncbi:RNA polymerase sigma factor [Lachnoclostridium sp. An118]|uniref:RNA polymerase sigma factor n=1 Tax=Lachnoclostridium sp. An118 TaxID=1965547 RepID=UPI000B3845DE|nr:sigma-70 family RNA polymerase sigma factor [Lachnoclostridium sp. An118]OUQ46474.1 hypothetical protein B5E62_16075 [Lachnoclostridium sp. An118]
MRQQAFTRFYFQRDKYDPGRASLPLYLSVITRNLAISRYRKEQQQTALSTAAALSCPEDQQISLSELRADVEKAMETLQPEEAALIHMKYYGGMTTKEIAASLGLPYETVKKRHHQGLLRLGFRPCPTGELHAPHPLSVPEFCPSGGFLHPH